MEICELQPKGVQHGLSGSIHNQLHLLTTEKPHLQGEPTGLIFYIHNIITATLNSLHQTEQPVIREQLHNMVNGKNLSSTFQNQRQLKKEDR